MLFELNVRICKTKEYDGRSTVISNAEELKKMIVGLNIEAEKVREQFHQVKYFKNISKVLKKHLECVRT